MIFTPTVITHVLPAISINADEGTNPNAVTYNKIKQSMGSFNYLINSLYLYSTNIAQLTGSIQYQRFDANGDQNTRPIVTAVNPYQPAPSLYVDLQTQGTDFLLNGNATFNVDILPNTYILIRFFSDAVSGKKNDNFEMFDSFFETSNNVASAEAQGVPVRYASFDGNGKRSGVDFMIGVCIVAAAGIIAYKIIKRK